MAAIATNKGKTVTASLLAGASSAIPKYIGFGSGTHVAAATDTALTTEVGRVGTNNPTLTTTTLTDDTVNVAQTYTNASGSQVTIREAGLFDASSAGNMTASMTFDPVVLEPTESLLITVKTQVI